MSAEEEKVVTEDPTTQVAAPEGITVPPAAVPPSEPVDQAVEPSQVSATEPAEVKADTVVKTEEEEGKPGEEAKAAGSNVVWRLQYVPVLQPVGGDPNASIPANFSMPTTTTVNGQTTFVATMAPATAGEAKEGEEGTSEKAGEPAAVPHVFHAPQGLSQNMQGAQFIMAPPHMQASLGGPPGAAHFVMAPNFPQARISNEPGPNGVFTLDLTEDSTDLPLPMEDEVDLSTYSYKINLGKDVVSGKGGKVQQLNRHFRNMVAAAYPTYDSTSSKISKRKIGLKIYQAIIDRGGRFLDPDGKPMDRPKSVLKVMKALKDAKTWTSDAKRVAKRKRDEQKTRESLDKKPRMMEAPVVTGDEKDPLTSAAALASVEGIQPMVPVQAVVKEEAVVADDDKKEEGKDGDDSNVGGLDLLTKAAAGESGPKAKAEV